MRSGIANISSEEVGDDKGKGIGFIIFGAIMPRSRIKLAKIPQQVTPHAGIERLSPVFSRHPGGARMVLCEPCPGGSERPRFKRIE
jgi:hypothetical protein